MKNKIFTIQYLRGIASIMVVLRHSDLPYISWYFNWSIGVDIFFLISGFVINHTLSNNSAYLLKPNLFLINRFTRLIPAYIIFTTVFFALSFLINSNNSICDLVYSIFFINSNFTEYKDPILYTGWSLLWEIIFYFLVYIGLFFKRESLIIKVLLICGIIGLLGIFNSKYIIIDFIFSPFYLLFVSGFLLYPQITKINRKTPIIQIFKTSRGQLIIASLLILFVITKAIDVYYNIGIPRQFVSFSYSTIIFPRVFLWGLPAVFFFTSFLKFFSEKKTNNNLILLGDISFSMYLIHPCIFLVTNQFLPTLFNSHGITNVIFKIIGILLTFVLSIVSRKYVEVIFSNKIKSYLIETLQKT